jgi:hypothetical protein
VETIRTWSFLTAFWRDTGIVQTTPNTAFYNINSIINGVGESLLSQTVKDQDIVTAIQYHLLEPATGNSWSGSDQFTLADITTAIEKRRNQFLAETACVVTLTTGISEITPISRLSLSDTTIAVRRVAFRNDANVVSPLWPESISNQMAFAPDNLLTPGGPVSYSIDSARVNEVILAPPISDIGTFETITVSTGTPLDPTMGVILGIPDDMSWAIKWGALADILGKDSQVRDADRAGFCERKYRMALSMAKYAPVVLSAQINGSYTFTDSIANLDSFLSTWQSTIGTPTFLGMEPNLIAVGPVPSEAGAIQLDVVRKAPISSGSAFVQIGREYIDVIIDYALHLACFKMGGIEFRNSFRNAQNFFDAALNYNQRLSALSPIAVKIMRNSTRTLEDRPFELPGGVGTLQNNTSTSTTTEQRPQEV